MNIEKVISTEKASIERYISEAQSQYDNQQYSAVNALPPDYRVLFVLVRNISVNNTLYSVNSTEENIFEAATENFKLTVEDFTHYNVHIVYDKEYIDETVSTSGGRTSLIYQDIKTYLDKYHTLGIYDAVFFASKECGLGGASTQITMFEWRQLLHGYTHLEIPSSDGNRLSNSSNKKIPYLITTNYFIHEWMHQLEGGYRTYLDIIYPFTHAYGFDYNTNPTEDWQYKDNYNWDRTYFTEQSHPTIVEPDLTSYYRAVLACEVDYAPSGATSRKVGMYPLFWRLVPHKVHIGQYIVQKISDSKYKCTDANGTVTESLTLSNNENFIWSVYYSLSDSDIKIQNIYKSNYLELSRNVQSENAQNLG